MYLAYLLHVSLLILFMYLYLSCLCIISNLCLLVLNVYRLYLLTSWLPFSILFSYTPTFMYLDCIDYVSYLSCLYDFRISLLSFRISLLSICHICRILFVHRYLYALVYVSWLSCLYVLLIFLIFILFHTFSTFHKIALSILFISLSWMSCVCILLTLAYISWLSCLCILLILYAYLCLYVSLFMCLDYLACLY